MASSDWIEIVSTGVEATRAAGRVLSDSFDCGTVVTSRSKRDIKTVADREANAAAIGLLAKTRIPVLSEEMVDSRIIAAADRFWILDPLDGTMNFTRSVPLTCVSLALWERWHPLWGGVYDFVRDELYVSEGADNDGGRLSLGVSSCTRPAEGILATGFPNGRSYDPQDLSRFVAQVRDFSKVRLLGSAALSLAWLAAGRLDAYTEQGIYLWDVAAGIALVRAAGGAVRFSVIDEQSWKLDVAAASTPQLLGCVKTVNNPQE